PLGIGKICRYGDDCFFHFLAEVGFGVGFHFPQNHGGDLLRCVFLIVDGEFMVRSHVPLGGGHRPFGIGHGLPFGQLPDQALAALGEPDHRWGGPAALGVGNNHRFTAFDHRHTGICCSQVNTEYFCHFPSTSNSLSSLSNI